MKARLIAAALILAAAPAWAAQISEYLSAATDGTSVPAGWIACKTTGECRQNNGASAALFSTLPAMTPGAGGSTDITIVESPTNITVQSSSGADDTIALANGTNAGAMSPGHYTKLEGIEAAAAADQTAAEVPNAPAGNIAATNVQEAINELDGEKAPVSTTVATTGNQTIGGVKTFTSDLIIPNEAYGVGWNASLEPPTKDAVYDQIQSLSLGSGFYATDGDVGLIIDPSASSVTDTWAPNAADGYTMKATATACALDVLAITGTVGTGSIWKELEITNSCGSDLVVTFGGLTTSSTLLPSAKISNGQKKAFAVKTINQGTNWTLETGDLDISTLPAGTVAGTDVLVVQDVSPIPDSWVKVTAQAIANLFVEANNLGTVTGTLGVANGGTGRTTGTTAYGLIAAGTTAAGAQQTLAAGATTEVLVGGGASALPVWTTATGTGAPMRGTSPTVTTGVNIDNADTTITRTGAGAIAVEGVGVALNSTSLPHTASQLEVGAASDTTIARNAAGRVTVEGKRLKYLGTTTTESGAARTLSAGDDVLFISWTNTGAKTYTIATGTAAANDEWTGCNNGGTGDLTVVQGSGMTLIGSLVFNPGECYLIKFTSPTTANVIGGGAS